MICANLTKKVFQVAFIFGFFGAFQGAQAEYPLAIEEGVMLIVVPPENGRCPEGSLTPCDHPTKKPSKCSCIKAESISIPILSAPNLN